MTPPFGDGCSGEAWALCDAPTHLSKHKPGSPACSGAVDAIGQCHLHVLAPSMLQSQELQDNSSGADGLTATYRNTQRPAAPSIRPTAFGLRLAAALSQSAGGGETAFVRSLWSPLPLPLSLDIIVYLPTYPTRLRDLDARPPTPALISRTLCTPRKCCCSSAMKREAAD